MDISKHNQNITITNSTFKVKISGMNNYITIKASIHYLLVFGANNTIIGTDQNCLVDILNIEGANNNIILNRNCSNVAITDRGNNNHVLFH